MDAKKRLKSDAAKIIRKATKAKENILSHLEKPPKEIDSDLAFPAFALSKKLKKDPKTIAKEISKSKPSGLIKDMKASGPYVNFYADWDKLARLALKQVLKEKDRYGSGKEKGKILLEHTSANPDGPLHLGHFRNSVIGDSLARILEFSGYKVKTDFLVNDIGRQIAIAVLEYRRKNPKPEGKPDHWVADLYVKGNKELDRNPELEREIADLMEKIEKGDKKTLKDFSHLVDQCIKGHKQTLSRLGIEHDSFTKESRFIQDGSMEKLLKKYGKLPEGKKDGKRLWLDLKKFGIKREFTLTRKDGTSIYPARDLAYHQNKFAKADKNINIIGTDQKFYFRQLKAALSLIFPEKTENYPVVFYEFLLLPEGAMSTRAGKFIAIDDVLEEAQKTSKKVVKKKSPDYTDKLQNQIAEVVAVGALKYAMIKVEPEKTYSFSVEDTLSFEGNNAPYLQYTHARASSILRKGKLSAGKYDASKLGKPKEKALIEAIIAFPGVVSDTARDLKPNYLANYSYRLATLFNDFYNSIRVLQARNAQTKQARLALVKAFQITMKNSLSLLGIEAPEVM